VIPEGGDLVSARVAFIQHQLVCRYRNGEHPSGAALGREFGFSTSTWSRTFIGERFPGSLVFAAMLKPIMVPNNKLPGWP